MRKLDNSLAYFLPVCLNALFIFGMYVYSLGYIFVVFSEFCIFIVSDNSASRNLIV